MRPPRHCARNMLLFFSSELFAPSLLPTALLTSGTKGTYPDTFSRTSIQGGRWHKHAVIDTFIASDIVPRFDEPSKGPVAQTAIVGPQCVVRHRELPFDVSATIHHMI